MQMYTTYWVLISEIRTEHLPTEISDYKFLIYLCVLHNTPAKVSLIVYTVLNPTNCTSNYKLLFFTYITSICFDIRDK
jgi:hypothetical protein